MTFQTALAHFVGPARACALVAALSKRGMPNFRYLASIPVSAIAQVRLAKRITLLFVSFRLAFLVSFRLLVVLLVSP